jgi:site-specific recombinase XerD
MNSTLQVVPFTPDPDLARIKRLVLDCLASPHSRRAYDRALTDFLQWYAAEASGAGLNKATVQRYALRLAEQDQAASTRNVRLTAEVRNTWARAIPVSVRIAGAE